MEGMFFLSMVITGDRVEKINSRNSGTHCRGREKKVRKQGGKGGCFIQHHPSPKLSLAVL